MVGAISLIASTGIDTTSKFLATQAV